jgi:hypothetical protein
MTYFSSPNSCLLLSFQVELEVFLASQDSLEPTGPPPPPLLNIFMTALNENAVARTRTYRTTTTIGTRTN